MLGPLVKSLVTLPNGIIFKALSDKPVGVLTFSKNPILTCQWGFIQFAIHLLSTDWWRLFRERFVPVASQDLSGEPYMIFAFEPSEVTLTGGWEETSI